MQGITRISVPKFRIGRNKLNEYELRMFMLEVAQGLRKPAKLVVDTKGSKFTMTSNGQLHRMTGDSVIPFGMGLADEIAIKHFNLT